MKTIQTELSKPKEIDIQQLADIVGSGGSFRAAAINGISDEGFISQQLFVLDIDNSKKENGKEIPMNPILTIEKAQEIAEANNIKPIFIYKTFSDSEALPKFRIVFCLDRKITNVNERKNIQLYFMGIYGKYPDNSCKNPSRLFFGGNKGIIKADFEAILDSEKILSSIPKVDTINSLKKANKRPQKAIIKKSAANMDNIEAIRTHDIDYLRKKLDRKPRIFDNRQEFYDFLYHEIDLAELLEVEVKNNFCCIFHEDHEPSANVYKEKYGIWKYKCFGNSCQTEGKALNTKQVIELLGNFDSEYKVIEFIKAIYNVSIAKTEWAQEQEANIDAILHSLASNKENSFKELCPTAAENTIRYQELFMKVLCIAKNCIYPERTTENGNIIFYMSVSEIMKAAGKGSRGRVQGNLKILIYHGLLEIIPDEKVPPAFLKKQIAGSKNKKNHTQFYSIPSWVFKHLQYVEKQGQKWKDNKYRVAGISREMFLRTEGEEVANWLYPQTSHYTNKQGEKVVKQTSKKSNQLHDKLAQIILDQIQSNEYTTEKEIIEIAQAKIERPKNIIETQLKRSLTDIMNCYNLTKRRANKAIKEQYEIQSKGYPAIIHIKD